MKRFPNLLVLFFCLSIFEGMTGCRDQSHRADPPGDAFTNQRNDRQQQGGGPTTSNPETSNALNGTTAGGGVVVSGHGEAAQRAAPSAQQDIDLASVGALIESGSLDEAEGILKSYLVRGGDDPAALFQYAKLQAAKGELDAAIATLDQPAIKNSEAALPAMGQSADWLVQLNRPYEAERLYREILKVAPEATVVYRALANVLLRSGRSSAAVEPIRMLCRSGDIRQAELANLIIVRDAIELPIIGPVAEARSEASKGHYLEATEWLEQVVDDPGVPPDVEAFYLRLLAEAQREDDLVDRLALRREGVERYGDYWASLGTVLMVGEKGAEAAAAFLRAIELDPSDTHSIQRLRQSLRMSGDESFDERLAKHYRRCHNMVMRSNEIAAATAEGSQQSNQIVAAKANELAGLLNECGRRLEAVLWQSISAQYSGDTQALQRSQEVFRQIASSPLAFPNQDQLTLGIDTNQLPSPAELLAALPNLRSIENASDGSVREGDWSNPPKVATWENVAESVGLKHQFHVASQPQRDGFAIYQTLGGGVAVLDIDRDGFSDLYFAQGGCDPPSFLAEADEHRTANSLFRNVGGRVVEVTENSATSSGGYSIGVTAGDWNQDGFDDLFVNRFGSIDVMTNQGDGTFQLTSVFSGGPFWTPASIGLADVNSDGLQDLIALAYADRELVFTKPPRDGLGRPTKSIGPSNFAGGENQLIAGKEDGWASAVPLRNADPAPGTSLGVVLGNLLAGDNLPGGGKGRQVFVGNDQQNNRLWTFNGAHGAGPVESAIIDGCAYGNYGTATAAMGIATADFNQDGFVDMHITNYHSEPVSLYEGTASGFRDATVRRGLLRHSVGVLGFGCAPVDFDLNGLPDLIVTNGHVDDTTEVDEPFEQPMQLFALQEGRYQLMKVVDLSGYWEQMHVGRAMAMLDFNRDGRDDVVITNLNENAALLLNQTSTAHHWLRLDLIGTESPRFPVGAKIEVASQPVRHGFVVAGDGYLCRNEPVVSVGLGDHQAPVDVTVTWPNGRIEVFKTLAVDRIWQLLEGGGAFEVSGN